MSDTPNQTVPLRRGAIRRAMLDLISSREAACESAGLFAEDRDLLDALQDIVRTGQRPGDALGVSYRPDRSDAMARIFADFDF